VEETGAGEVQEEAVEPVVVRALPLVAIPPCRLLDTRTVGLPLLSGVAQEVAVVGRCGIPAQAQGVSLRLMVAESVGRGEVSLGGTGEGARAGRLVLEVGEARSTTGVAALDQTGQLLVSADNGSAHVIVDANGYYAPEPAVRSLNALAGDVVLEAGENVEITTEGSVVTIALARGEGREGERPQESQPSPLGPRVPARRLVQVPASQPTRTLPPVKAMAPPSSSLYVAGALGLPDTTALGAGALTLGGDSFLHNYGPASDAGNTFVGEGTGNFTMGGLESWEGKANTAIGSSSLTSNATGDSNTASGSSSLLSNTKGYQNTASGVASLYSNTTGCANTANGLDGCRARIQQHREWLSQPLVPARPTTPRRVLRWGLQHCWLAVAFGR
jgi:hypothetical protein